MFDSDASNNNQVERTPLIPEDVHMPDAESMMEFLSQNFGQNSYMFRDIEAIRLIINDNKYQAYRIAQDSYPTSPSGEFGSTFFMPILAYLGLSGPESPFEGQLLLQIINGQIILGYISEDWEDHKPLVVMYIWTARLLLNNDEIGPDKWHLQIDNILGHKIRCKINQASSSSTRAYLVNAINWVHGLAYEGEITEITEENIANGYIQDVEKRAKRLKDSIAEYPT